MANEMKHTPGPWSADAVMSDEKHDICLTNPVLPTSETGWPVVIASVYFDKYEPIISKDEADANATLMAASPDLLEALENLLAHTTRYFNLGEVGGKELQIMLAAQAAIAKAKGESK